MYFLADYWCGWHILRIVIKLERSFPGFFFLKEQKFRQPSRNWTCSSISGLGWRNFCCFQIHFRYIFCAVTIAPKIWFQFPNKSNLWHATSILVCCIFGCNVSLLFPVNICSVLQGYKLQQISFQVRSSKSI